MGKKKESCPPGAPAWMTTFGDMMTLLLTFFVLIVSMSSVEVEKFRAAMASFQGSLGIISNRMSMHQIEAIIETPTTMDKLSLEEIGEEVLEQETRRMDQALKEEMEKMQEMLDQMGLNDMVDLEPVKSGILIRIKDEMLFDVGKADLKTIILPILDGIGRMSEVERNDIIVEGHTDNSPINTAYYPSNWELSAARSARIIRYFIDNFDVAPERFELKGYSEYRPIADNKTAEGKAKNRRIEILIKRELSIEAEL